MQIFGEVYMPFFVAGAAFSKMFMIIILKRICSWRARKVPLEARRVVVCIFMVGSCSDRSYTGNNSSTVFRKFPLDLGMQFCVAGALFGEVGG